MRGLDDLDVAAGACWCASTSTCRCSIDADGAIEVADDTRIRAALPTIEELRARGARLVLVSHLGPPQGPARPGLSLAPVAARLRELLTGAQVDARAGRRRRGGQRARRAAGDGRGAAARERALRAGRDRQRPELARALAELADVYVNDAFGAAHRAHASTEGVAHLLPSAAGRLLGARGADARAASSRTPRARSSPSIGGSKVADKIGVIERFLQLADAVLIGGAMCFPFFAAQGHEVGESLCGEEDIEHARHGSRRSQPRARAASRGRARLLSCRSTW